MLIIGIDPGNNGAIGWLSRDDSGAIVMPMLDKRVEVNTLLGLLCNKRPDMVIIEIPQVMGKGGQQTGLTIGLNYGLIIGVLLVKGIPVHEVHPATWKRAMGLTKRSKEETPRQIKERSIRMALQQFPSVDFKASPRCTTYHDGMAEALLIAEYGRRLLINKRAIQRRTA